MPFSLVLIFMCFIYLFLLSTYSLPAQKQYGVENLSDGCSNLRFSHRIRSKKQGWTVKSRFQSQKNIERTKLSSWMLMESSLLGHSWLTGQSLRWSPGRVDGKVGYKEEQFSLALQEWCRRARSKSPTASETLLNNEWYLFMCLVLVYAQGDGGKTEETEVGVLCMPGHACTSSFFFSENLGIKLRLLSVRGKRFYTLRFYQLPNCTS